MGDRANVYVRQREDAPGIYLYTHWSGYEWPECFREALAFGQGRWDDPSYLTRILISRMFRGLVDEQTGGGVSVCGPDDNGHPIIVCDIASQTVAFAPESEESDPASWYGRQSFADYAAQTSADYPTSVDV